MRTVVNIRDDLLERAAELTGLRKKVEIVNAALASFVRQKEIERIGDLAGEVDWEGDLDAMREERIGSG